MQRLFNQSQEDKIYKLVDSVGSNDIEKVRSLFSPTLINYPCEQHAGRTALTSAVWFGYVGMVSLLVNKGASINAFELSGDLPIHVAARNINNFYKDHYPAAGIRTQNSVAILKFLISKGADLHDNNKWGQTAFDICSEALLKIDINFFENNISQNKNTLCK
jgi:ankyrin repeat protein